MDSKKINVLHITPMYPSVERPAFGSFVKTQIDSLQNIVNIELLILPGLGGVLPYLMSIPRIFKSFKGQYDIIHIHYGNASSLIKMLYHGSIPIVTSYCGDDLQGAKKDNGDYYLKSILFKKINIYFSMRDTYSIVKSELLAHQIKENANKIEIIPNGINMSKFKSVEKKIAREKLGIPLDAGVVILFPADPNRPSKNFSFLKKVLLRFDGKFKYTILTFKEGKVDPEFVPYYYYASDIVAFPSLSEGSPNAIKEAMACNSIIFSSDCGDVSWLLSGVNGSKVLPLQTGEWVQAFHEYFRGKISRPISNSREILIKKELDVDSIANRISKLYLKILSENSY